MIDDGWFGEDVAAGYDDDTAGMVTSPRFAAQVELLASLARDGPALELAIGTGRVALPLAARGVRVSGIELSRAMVARLRAKPGGDENSVPVVIGDMTTTRIDPVGGFTLVYLVFNTIGNVTTQQGQVDVFRNAAAHLAPGGRFLIETGVPSLRRLPPGERYVVFDVADDHIGIDEYDPATQRSWSHHVTREADGTTSRVAMPFRYVWPSELDLMAMLADLELEDRWADWDRSPFTNDSQGHVSVWRKPPVP
jgi:SAM-dependent methyltransferase